MIPRRLRLTNFLSHAETDVDFRALHAAVLTGHNGAGKSSLLDAITWALWGQARAAGDQVVRLGEAECAVELVVESAGVEYTIRRRVSTHKRVNQSLEFFAEGRPLTRAGVRETQAAITEALRMDYETFVASAFLAQGKADVFTASTPKARKDLLGEVLGLARYDVLADAARDKMKAAHDQSAGHRATVDRLRANLDERDALHQRLTEAQAAAREATATRADAEGSHAALVAKEAEVRVVLAEVERHDKDRREASSAATAAENLLAIKAASVASLEKQAAGHEAARQRHAEWLAAAAVVEAGRGAADAWARLDRQAEERLATGRAAAADLRHAWTARTEARRATRAEKERALAALQGALAGLPGLLASRNTAAARLAETDDVTAQFEAARDEGVALQGRHAEAIARCDAARREIREAEGKIEGLVARLAAAPDGAPCPTCARPLTEHALAEVRGELERARADAAARAQTALGEAEGFATEMTLKREECERLRDALRARADLQQQVAKLDAQIQALGRDEAAAAGLAEAIADLDAPDREADYLHGQAGETERATDAAYAAIIAERDATGHVVHVYAGQRLEAMRLADAPAAWQAAQDALLAFERARGEVARLEADLAGQREAIRRAIAGRAEAEARLLDVDHVALPLHLQAAAERVEMMRAAERGAGRLVADAEAALARLDADAQALGAAEAAFAKADQLATDYATLLASFGRNGIQAQALECAIPEIEEEANRILADLGDNRTRVQLVTQREKKTGGTAETLEVRIADDAGERPYECYSGGEAFRVNFALRLALSRLLARRTGAPLQMLVIDEGFGTQDEKGRERLLQAINAIAPEFRLILIVTHIRELKEAFNDQIEVTKRDGVSHVRMVA